MYRYVYMYIYIYNMYIYIIYTVYTCVNKTYWYNCMMCMMYYYERISI